MSSYLATLCDSKRHIEQLADCLTQKLFKGELDLSKRESVCTNDKSESVFSIETAL
jgi:hypothetical protein